MEKKQYYINLGTREISQVKYGNNESFTIMATDDEIETLRSKMNNMDEANFRNFFRAHVPIMPYHKDQSNDDYDNELTEAYKMIYELGDEETKQHIDQMGIFGDKHL